MTDQRTVGIFKESSPEFEGAGFAAIPVNKNSKKPAAKDWMKASALSREDRKNKFRSYGDCNIGLVAGIRLSTGKRLAFVDVDDTGFIKFASAILAGNAPAKTGSKGVTFFCQAEDGLDSRKITRKGKSAPAVELFISTGQTVVPPSIHPSGVRYRWLGKPLQDYKHDELPILDSVRCQVIEMVVPNPHTWEIVEGGADIKAHQAMLSLTGSGIANLTDDLTWLADCLNALLPDGYQGNTASETLGMLQSAKKKGLGRSRTREYDPGETGPVPLGYNRDGNYALLDPIRRIIVSASAQQLLAGQYLLGLSQSDFWANQFPGKKGFNAVAAGEALIAVCKRKGSFLPSRVRGRGIWHEGDTIVVNLGDPVPDGLTYLYLCFEKIEFAQVDTFETARLHKYLGNFRWRNPQDAMLLLGWLAIAPICGVLSWRPHCFLYGPPRCGKTTIHSLAGALLSPFVISTDGQSSEAGIRQTLGPDSLPVIIDEFESDHQGASLRGVLRLARSASSADNPVLRGTPEGKAMQFSLRTTFFFCAVNPGRMSPADQTRIMMLELTPHDSNPRVAKELINEEAYFRSLKSRWCGYMVSMAHLIGPALNELEAVIPSTDRRHRQNFATLLAGAFVALNGRAPTAAEAQQWADEYTPAVERHAEEIERDNAQECLNHLLGYEVEHFPLRHWIAVSLLDSGEGHAHFDAIRIMALYDIITRSRANAVTGVLIRNGSPAIDKVFQNTSWEGRGWERALRALEGVFKLKDPIYFTGARTKSRCIGIPTYYIPDAIETWVPEPND